MPKPRVDASTPPERWPQFLTLEEAGILLGVSDRTVRRMVAAGELREAGRLGRLRRIRASELLARSER